MTMDNPTWDSTQPVPNLAANQAVPSIPTRTSSVPTWDTTFDPEEKYGNPLEQAKAGAEALARGVSLGTSDLAETKLGISTPEAVKGRREANPITSFLGEATGSIAPILGTEGLAAPLALGKIGSGALVGGALGLGNAITDVSLGDPNLNAQMILTDIGGGIVGGAGFGALEKNIAALPALFRGAAKEAAPVAAESVAAGTAKPISSIEEAAQRLSTAQKYGNLNVERPEAGAVQDALSRVNLGEFSPPQAQIEAIANPDQVNPWNLAREMHGSTGDTVRGVEAAQKQYAVSALDKTLEDLSPGVKPTANAAEGGKRATEAFTEQYQNEKTELKPVFEALKKVGGKDQTLKDVPGLVSAFSDALPGVARMFDTEAKELAIKPYQTNWGISKSTYSAVKEAVDSLESSKNTSLEELMNIRNGLKQHENILEQGQGPGQIRALSSAMMDYMQGKIDNKGYSFEMRNILKNWAINEQQREIIEKTFGSAVGNPQFGAKAMKGLVNESIGDKIFANSASVRAAKQILPPEKFNQLLSNWVSEYREKVTQDGVFSSNKFNSFLRRNEDALKEAFGDSPTLQRLHDLTTVMRILPDAKSINPSGTAKTLMGMVKETFHGDLTALYHGAKEVLDKKLTELHLNEALAGKAGYATKLKSLEDAAKRVQSSVVSGAKSLYGSPLTKSLAINASERMSHAMFEDISDRLKTLSSNPSALSDHLTNSMVALSQTAPNITQGMQSTVARGVQFLSSKLPTRDTTMPLSHQHGPSDAEIVKFSKYFTAANKPLSVFSQVKNAKLYPETMETLQAVHPDLLNEMRKHVMENFKAEKAREMPFSHQAALATFLGSPLNDNMTPKTTAINQQVYSQPNLSQQGTPNLSRSSLGGLKKLDLSGRTSTRARDVENGK